MVGEYNRHFVLAQQRDEFGRAKTIVADFDDVTQRAAVDFVRQQFEEAAEIGGVEFFGRRELPEQGAEMVAKPGDAGIEKALDGVARLLEHPAIDGKARALEREHEILRHLARPFAERGRCLRAVERAVDLDRGQPFGGVRKLLRMRQALGVERAAPRLEIPAADTDADVA